MAFRLINSGSTREGEKTSLLDSISVSSRQSKLQSQRSHTRHRRSSQSVKDDHDHDEPKFTLDHSSRSRIPYEAAPVREWNQVNLVRHVCFRHKLPPYIGHHQSPPPRNEAGDVEFTQPTPLLAGRYRYCSPLGHGGFCQLVACEDMYDKNRRKLAIKMMKVQFADIGNQEHGRLLEAGATGAGKHVNLVQCYGKFEFFGHICIVFELLGRTAEEVFLVHPSEPIDSIGYTRSASVESLKRIALHLVQALTYLDRREILHADIKPGNVMIDSEDIHTENTEASLHPIPPATDVNRATLVDLGNAFTYEEISDYCSDFDVQSLGYRAPEVLCGVRFGGKIDVWSTGIVLAECASGRRLVPATTREEALQHITALLGPLPTSLVENGAFSNIAQNYQQTHVRHQWSRMEVLSSLSSYLGRRDPYFLHFLAECLALDPAKRLSPFEALFHPFLQSVFPLNYLIPPSHQFDKSVSSTIGVSEHDENGLKEEDDEVSNKKREGNNKRDKSSLVSIFEGTSPNKSGKHHRTQTPRNKTLSSLEMLVSNNQSSNRKKSPRGFRSLVQK
eukprot:gb/GECG01002871.1/.p1 GENE.gb/GECG01002871.1/~~gb/GECG01002871.1/.p1  ORF type:complete len:561 (+),score=51.59 gb/GECG01002871.1/:1-1683(+)